MIHYIEIEESKEKIKNKKNEMDISIDSLHSFKRNEIADLPSNKR